MFKVIICHKEKEYAFRLMNYLNRNSNGRILAYVLADPEEVVAYCRSHGIDSVLLDKDWKTSEKLEISAQIYWLSEQESKEENAILLYSSAEEILRQLLRLNEKQCNQKQCIPCDTAGVMAPFSEFYGTQYARQMAAAQDALYWEWKPYSGFREAAKQSEQLIYDIKNRDKELGKHLSEYLVQDKEIILPSPRCCMDLREVNCEDLEWFFHVLAQEGYQKVIMDVNIGCIGDLRIFSFIRQWKILLPEQSSNTTVQETFLQYFKLAQVPEEAMQKIWLGENNARRIVTDAD